MQLHIHAHRNNNSAMFERLGPDAGFDSIYTGSLAGPLVRLLDGIEQGADCRVAMTIICPSVSPCALAVMVDVPGLAVQEIQFVPASSPCSQRH
jgi:glucuronate isomerase